jgi:hypothetical protein
MQRRHTHAHSLWHGDETVDTQKGRRPVRYGQPIGRIDQLLREQLGKDGPALDIKLTAYGEKVGRLARAPHALLAAANGHVSVGTRPVLARIRLIPKDYIWEFTSCGCELLLKE